jgi:hypothetical protein
LEYLTQQNHLEDDTSALLKDVEPRILNLIYGSKLNEINISKGISGLGLYCLHRIFSLTPADPFQQLRQKEAVIACVDQIDRALKQKNSLPGKNGFSLMDGYSGVLLFLNWVNKLKWYEPIVRNLMQNIIEAIMIHIEDGVFSWQKCEIYFVLLYCNIVDEETELNEKIVLSVKHYMDEAAIVINGSINFPDAAFNALWLELIGKLRNMDSAIFFSREIKNRVIKMLENNNLGNLFPFSREKRSIEVSLRGELCASALPLLCLETQNYSWLSIFGIYLPSSVKNG